MARRSTDRRQAAATRQAGRGLSRFEPLEPRQMLDGEGLTGRYYDTAEFTSLKATRVDATVDFDWGTGSPATGVAATTYSVRWTGAVVPEFSEMVTFTVTADDGVRLWVDDELIINHWVNQDARGVSGQIALRAGVATPLTLEYFQSTGTASVRLEWSSRSMPRQVIPQARLNATVTPDNRGTALQETWTGVAGGTVADLTGSAAYAGPPAYRQMITSLQSLQQDVGDSNGSRVRGFIVPPATGSYVFSVAGNDDVRLSLGTDANPATATRIAFTSAVTAPLEWTKTSTQTSAAISLVQGRRYFFEVLHKENAGFNHWAVGWTTPLSSAVAVIGADAIEPWGATTTLPASGILDGMSTGRNRILTSPEMLARAKALVAQGGAFKTWYDTVVARADLYLTDDLPSTTAPTAAAGGTQPVLAGLEDNLTYLAGAYALRTAVEGNETNTQKYFDKAKAIIENVIQWTTWDTGSQFLGAAMVSQGISLCYDWMHPKFTSTERKAIADKLYTLAIKPTIDACTAKNYWTQWYGNWAFVCIGGVGSAALAIAPEYYKAETETLLAKGWPVLQSSMQHFAGENGGWHEGPGYMGYGGLYLIRLMSNLQTAVGTDFALSLEKGFQQTPTFLVGISTSVTGSANNGTFPYGNGDWSQNGDPWFNWLAARFNRGDVAKVTRDRVDATTTTTVVTGGVTSGTKTVYSFRTPWSLLWYDERGDSATGRVQSQGAAAARTDTAFFGDPRLLQWGASGQQNYSEHVNVWRDSWATTSSTVMFKGGYKGTDGHENFDGGSFLFDALGQRWATDLGRDSYSIPQVGGTNYGAYRKRAEGQNTLVINPTANDYLSSSDANERALNADQVYKDATGKPAYAEVIKSLSTDLQSIGVVDLTNLYSKMRVSTVQRGFTLDRTDGSLLVQDEITAATAPEICWFMHLPVAYANRASQIAISTDGKTATVTIGTNRLQLRILAGNGATFSVSEAAPLPSSPNPSGQAGTSGVCKLTIRYTGTTSERLAVWMVPLKSGQAAPTTAPAVAALAAWVPKANRQAWAGDLDGYASASIGDASASASTWSNQITRATGLAMKPLDSATANRVTPVTLTLPLTTGESVTWAKLAVGLKSTGATTSGDLLYLDSTTGQTYASLGWAAIDANATSRELTLSSAQLASLQDGTLNLALSSNTTVDWVHLQYATVGGTTVEDVVISVATGVTQTDATERSGAIRLVKRGAGTLVLTAASTIAGGMVVEQGTVIVRNASALGGGVVDVRGGATLVLDIGTAGVDVASLLVATTGKVDVGMGRLTISDGSAEVATIRQRLVAGRMDGTWTGSSGILSAAAAAAVAAGSSRSVGWLDHGDGSLTVAFAAPGDANLDGTVDVLDVANFVTIGKYNAGDAGGVADWADGDFTYDGLVDVLDLSEFISSGLVDAGSYLDETLVAVGYRQVNAWSSGFNGEVTIANQGATAISGWTLEFDLAATITSVWNATIVSHVAGHYVIQPVSSNWTIAAGASVSFGLQASGPAGTAPRNRKFNGIAV
jgi:autotransporter-associated beta strand protein